ncbi:hypothetical protein CFP56_042668 [Quercus suber]|uniref:Uncharacterized protein n=1 Tax=Quercus suber TaxID=58331 RepID=A0AAW0LK56_QUESU
MFKVQSSPKSWQCFRHMDEVTYGGNALKFYVVVTGLGVCMQVVKRLNGGIILGGGFSYKSERSWSWLVNMKSSSNKKATTS